MKIEEKSKEEKRRKMSEKKKMRQEKKQRGQEREKRKGNIFKGEMERGWSTELGKRGEPSKNS